MSRDKPIEDGFVEIPIEQLRQLELADILDAQEGIPDFSADELEEHELLAQRDRTINIVRDERTNNLPIYETITSRSINKKLVKRFEYYRVYRDGVLVGMECKGHATQIIGVNDTVNFTELNITGERRI